MATPVSTLHAKFLAGSNIGNSESLKDIDIPRRDIYLNEAKNWVHLQLARNFGKGGHFDEQISPFVIREEVLQTGENTERYLIGLRPKGTIRSLRISAMIEHVDDCCPPQRALVRPKTPDTIDEALRGEFTRPDWGIRETVSTLDPLGYRVYHGHDLKTTEIFLDYILEIKDMYYPTGMTGQQYRRPDGQVQVENVDFESDSVFYLEHVCDLAVLYALNDTGKIANFQSQFQEKLRLPEAAIR